MTPREKQYQTSAEKQKAFRERKKKSLLQKLKDSLNGNHALQPESSSLQPEKDAVEEHKKVVVIDTKSIQSLGSPNQLGSEALSSKCVWCGTLAFVVQRRGGICSDCKQYRSREEMLHMSRVLSNLSILPKDINKKRIYDEELAKFRGGNPSKFPEKHKLN